jgi:CHAT domain-containing protein
MRQYGAMGLAELVKLVGAEVISEEEAARRATASDWAWDDNQILGAVEAVSGQRRSGNLKGARLFASLLMGAVEQVRPELWRVAALEFVQVATEVVAEELDGALYRQASDVAARLLPGADANTLLTVAHLKLEPFAVDPICGTYPEREQGRQARLKLRDWDWSDKVAMPAPEQPLAEAQALFAALADKLTGVGRGVALAEQAYAAFSLAKAGGQVARKEYLALCASAWPLLGNEPLGTARACWILAQHDAFGRVAGHPMVMPPAKQLMDAYGPRTATVVIAIGAWLFGQHDRNLARSLCKQVVAALPEVGFESRRAWFASLPAHVLPDDPTECATIAAAGPLTTLTTRGRGAGWTHAQVIDATLHALAHDATTVDISDVGLGDVGPDRVDLRNRVLADHLERVGRSLMTTDDAAAMVKLILAAELHAENNNPEAAESCLQLATLSAQESHDAALVKWADQLVAGLGRPGVSALDKLYRACLIHLHEPGQPLPFFALMQLMKGRAFARFRTAPGPLIPFTDVEAEALAEADAARALLPSQAEMTSAEPHSDLLVEEMFLEEMSLGAYLLDAEMQAGRTPAEELANRRRICQRLDAIRLNLQGGPAPVLAEHHVRRNLAPEAVLVSIYEGGVLTPPMASIVYGFTTIERTWSVTVAYPDDALGDMSIVTSESGLSRRVRYTSGAFHVANVRQVLLEDPLNRLVSREAEPWLAAEAVRFEALLDQLAELHHAGKRQLAIWPHGPYHFFPFHLLPSGNGRIVADDWTVVLVPSLQSVVGVPRMGGRESLLAIASPDGGVRYGLAAEPDVTQQVRMVSEAFCVEPLQGTAATTARFLSGAGRAQFIHLAAHGSQYLPAPLFDAIYLADGPLHAHQVLHMDLRGVELVTLSSCESAMLRFDLSDNLHGMAAAFLRAGAAAVVGALWPVQAAVANTFFAELYGCLARGQGKLTAFREAQSVTRTQHPHYRDWAAFTMIGDCWER